MTWRSCAQFSQTFPEDGYANLSPSDSGFLRIHIVTPVVPASQILIITQPNVELAWPDHSIILTTEMFGTDCSADYSCTARDLHKPFRTNIWSL